MNNIQKHDKVMNLIHETYIQKNRAYGNSFDESLDDFGIIAAMTRMSDKWNRLRTLTKDSNIPVGDESIKDTLLDLANYAVMTYMWLDKAENILKKKPMTLDEYIEKLQHKEDN